MEHVGDTEALLRLIFDRSGLAIALVSADGTLLRCNGALERLLGYSEDELLDTRFTDFTHPDDVHLDWSLYAELVAGKRRDYQIEKRYLHRDGHQIWGRLTVSLLAGTDGSAPIALGMV